MVSVARRCGRPMRQRPFGVSIGFAVDDRWAAGKPVDIALKATYFDKGMGNVDVGVGTSGGNVTKQIKLTNDGKLKTATFFINDAVFPAKNMDYDITFKATADEPMLSFVRIIRLINKK